MRISGFQAHMASRLNEPRIDFTQEEIKTSYQDIIKNIEENSSKEIIKSKDITGIKYS
jgi:hypothetical protein